MIFFKTKQSKQIDAVLADIVAHRWPWIVPPLYYSIARQLQECMVEQGIALSEKEAYKRLERYDRHFQIQVQRAMRKEAL